MLTVFFAAVGFVGFILLLAALFYLYRNRKRLLEAQFENQELQNLKTKMELNYYKDWRIDQADITLVRKLASGGEGTAWLGTKRGHLSNVCVKVKHATPDKEPVWEEREVVCYSVILIYSLYVCVCIAHDLDACD